MKTEIFFRSFYLGPLRARVLPSYIRDIINRYNNLLAPLLIFLGTFTLITMCVNVIHWSYVLSILLILAVLTGLFEGYLSALLADMFVTGDQKKHLFDKYLKETRADWEKLDTQQDVLLALMDSNKGIDIEGIEVFCEARLKPLQAEINHFIKYTLKPLNKTLSRLRREESMIFYELKLENIKK